MKSRTKKILLTSGIALGTFSLFANKKYNKGKKVLNELQLKVDKISKLRLSLSNVSFDAVLRLVNPTNINFGYTGTSKIVVKELRVFSRSGKLIGKASANLYRLDLPAFGSFVLPPLQVNIRAKDALEELLQNLEQYTRDPIKQLNFEIDVDVFGMTYTLKK